MEFDRDEIIREFERLFPLEFRVAILTLTNRKQADQLGKQAEQIATFQQSDEFWKGSDRPVSNRPEPE